MKKLLNISDLKKQDFFDIITLANNIDPENDISLNNKNIGLIFEKNSTRTRLSFQVGIRQMNGNYLDIKLEEFSLIIVIVVNRNDLKFLCFSFDLFH